MEYGCICIHTNTVLILAVVAVKTQQNCCILTHYKNLETENDDGFITCSSTGHSFNVGTKYIMLSSFARWVIMF